MYKTKTNLLKIAEEFGTPTYVYELDQVNTKVEQLRTAFAGYPLKIHYALKANYQPLILQELLDNDVAIDAVSPEEIQYVLELGFKAENIIFTANNLSNQEINYVKDKNILFNLGSLSELHRFAQTSPGSEICLRVNPDVVAGAHAKIQTGGPLSKFGILPEDFAQAIKIAETYNLKIVGIHQHTGSGVKETDKFLAAVDTLLSFANPERLPYLRFIDLGGGFYVPYSPEDPIIDYQKLGQAICERLQNISANYSRTLELYIEPGKFLVAECGHLLVEATTLKSNRDYLILGTNSGFNHLPRPVMYDAYHQITNLSHPDLPAKCYDIVGNICETGDNFATRRDVSEINEQDILAIHNAGAYCASMSSYYNLRRAPAEVCIKNNEIIYSRPQLSIDEHVQRKISLSK